MCLTCRTAASRGPRWRGCWTARDTRWTTPAGGRSSSATTSSRSSMHRPARAATCSCACRCSTSCESGGRSDYFAHHAADSDLARVSGWRRTSRRWSGRSSTESWPPTTTERVRTLPDRTCLFRLLTYRVSFRIVDRDRLEAHAGGLPCRREGSRTLAAGEGVAADRAL